MCKCAFSTTHFYAYGDICQRHLSETSVISRKSWEMTQVVAGSRRWWNLVDSVSLSLLLFALIERSRTLGNFVAMQRVGRLMRLPRFRMVSGSELCWKFHTCCIELSWRINVLWLSTSFKALKPGSARNRGPHNDLTHHDAFQRIFIMTWHLTCFIFPCVLLNIGISLLSLSSLWWIEGASQNGRNFKSYV
jgi:hypothetical protein